METTMTIGVDVGNSDTKTPNTTTPSGYTVQRDKPDNTIHEYLSFEGTYYVPSIRRFNYKSDKTQNERCFIMTLFGVAKEMIEESKKRILKANCSQFPSKELIQEEINKVHQINIGAGLPPTHCRNQRLKNSLIDYYKENFANGISFEYCDYHFNVMLDKVFIYPQDFAALFMCDKNSSKILQKYGSYYGIDIGGYTVDGIPIIKKSVDYDNCESKELGVLKLLDEIIVRVQEKIGIRLTPDLVEDVLMERETVLHNGEPELIREYAKKWTRRMIDEYEQYGYNFDVYPVIFLGGGSELLKPYIKEVMEGRTFEFHTSPNANAKGYKAFVDQMTQKKSA